MPVELARAIVAARSVRRRLVKWRGKELDGDCALASVLLATEIDDLSSLRMSREHVWNRFGDTIVDITATQFNDSDQDPYVRGVLITTTEHSYHTPLVKHGLEVLNVVEAEHWYGSGRVKHLWKSLVERWKERDERVKISRALQAETMRDLAARSR